MPPFKVVSLQDHGSRRWRRFGDYRFAGKDALAPLVLAELPQAVSAMPVAFVKRDDVYALAGLLGLQVGRNSFVDERGRWSGSHIPAVMRSYPFALLPDQQGNQLLCVDEGSGLVGNGPDGEPFFDSEGRPSKQLADLVAFLKHVAASRAVTERACAALAAHGLIRPWPLGTAAGVIDGLYAVDEARLNAVSGTVLEDLRSSGSLALAYCQLISMHHVKALAERTEKTTLPAMPSGELDLEFLNDGPLIDFRKMQ